MDKYGIVVDIKNTFEAVDVLISGMDYVERAEFFDHIRGAYPDEFGTSALENTVEVETLDEPFEERVDVISMLSPEQAERANKLKSAMAEKFRVDAADFSVLATEAETGEKLFCVAYTAGNGIYKGSWNKIMGNETTKDFVVEIDGQKFDTRTGMTLDVYAAMVERARANDEILPDSRQLSEENGQVWTWTLRTGEQAVVLNAPRASVLEDDSVYGGWCDGGDGGGAVRFRPAAVL